MSAKVWMLPGAMRWLSKIKKATSGVAEDPATKYAMRIHSHTDFICVLYDMQFALM